MSALARHHRSLGWAIALLWLLLAVGLVLAMPRIPEEGDRAVFLQWSLWAAPLAVVTWAWAYAFRWGHLGGITVFAGTAGVWFLLATRGSELLLGARDAFFMRQTALEWVLRAATWLYVLFPLLVMAAGCLAVVEYLRHPPRVVRHQTRS